MPVSLLNATMHDDVNNRTWKQELHGHHTGVAKVAGKPQQRAASPEPAVQENDSHRGTPP